MAELTAADVEDFTQGRLSADDDAVQGMLASALVRARRYVGWHVSPVIVADVVTVDGPGGPTLVLPTRKVVNLTAITEDGVALDVSGLNWSAKGIVRKEFGVWSDRYAAITVTMDHGLTEAAAADWRRSILSMVDEMSRTQLAGGRSDADLVRRRVDDVEEQWTDYGQAADRALYSAASVLDAFVVGPLGFS